MKHKLKGKLYQLIQKNLQYICEIQNGDKLLLVNVLKRLKKKVCAISQTSDVYFSITELDLLVLIQSRHLNDITRKQSHIILTKFQLIVGAMELSRNIYENMRRYIQYQLTIGVNLSFYIVLGNLFYNEIPLAPSTILWINYLMDTVSAIIFASVYPNKRDLSSAVNSKKVER